MVGIFFLRVHMAEVVLAVSNLVCCFYSIFPFHYPNCLQVLGEREPPFNVMFFCPVFYIMTFGMGHTHPQSLSFNLGVPRYSSPSLTPSQWPAASHSNRGKLRLGQVPCPHKARYIWREQAHITHLLISYSWEFQWMAPDAFGHCCGYCLEHTGSAVTALTKLLYFKGNLASLALCLPTQALQWPLFLGTQSPLPTDHCQGSYLG